VVYALAVSIGCTKEELNNVYRKKHEARGGFEKRILLISSEK
jgi:predicted house-cleaning noncanonical NTP pyrophosphatase (MazG superfamily)